MDEITPGLFYFPACNEFISGALAVGGRVLVHCMAGQSRSATAAAAYLMHEQKLTAEQAVQAVKQRRPQIYPNQGFLDQLDLYYDLGYEVTEAKPLYRRFLINHSAEYFREYGSVQHVASGADPSALAAKAGGAERSARCKKCRRVLVTEVNILEHQAGAGQMAFSYNKRNASGAETPHAFSQNHACSSLFVEPMEWMEGISEGLVESKIACPKCHAKLGAYNWAGAQCSCGKWITPSFQIHRNRIDELRKR
ncbi:protein-tyrosine phosphatase-like protein [Kickxella alabastrina]|uniref:protein-tyrosine phosphatase-like protein n=1 Tax=Kickxella alabastrina TaxID=61397 RepID=UPI00221FFE2D|nr:protein-tyrosine phosphatase-like protein [Kickxella alabastrina]KAI7834370.1 protein-tyrosine phosphatase-like protein [Kickxella alabastrina]